MSQVWRDGRSPKVTCSARTVGGIPCKRPPIKGGSVCRTHGGAAPHVRDAARVRILMSADAAAAKLIEMIHSKKVDDRTKLLAVKDLLDRANLSGTQNVEVGITKRDFSDVTADVVMDLVVGEDDPLVLAATPREDIEDADVVDDNERWAEEDAQAERAKEIRRMVGRTPRIPTPVATDLNAERARQEAEALRQAERKPMRRTSTADPYADRFPETGERRTMSPKRREQRQRERGEG